MQRGLTIFSVLVLGLYATVVASLLVFAIGLIISLILDASQPGPPFFYGEVELSGKEVLPADPTMSKRWIWLSPDGKTIALVGDKRDVVLFDIVTGKQTTTLRALESVGQIAFSPNGKWVAAGSDSGKIRLWDRILGKESRHLQTPERNADPLKFTADSQRLAACGAHGQLLVYDVETLQLTTSFTLQGDRVYDFALLDAGRSVLYTTYSGEIGRWDARNDNRRVFAKMDERLPAIAAVLPDEKTFVMLPQPDLVVFYDAETGVEKRRFRVETGAIDCLSVSPNGKTIAVGCAHSRIAKRLFKSARITTSYVELRSTDTGAFRGCFKFSTENSSVMQVFFTDNQKVLTNKPDGPVTIWDLSSLQAR